MNYKKGTKINKYIQVYLINKLLITATSMVKSLWSLLCLYICGKNSKTSHKQFHFHHQKIIPQQFHLLGHCIFNNK